MLAGTEVDLLTGQIQLSLTAKILLWFFFTLSLYQQKKVDWTETPTLLCSIWCHPLVFWTAFSVSLIYLLLIVTFVEVFGNTFQNCLLIELCIILSRFRILILWHNPDSNNLILFEIAFFEALWVYMISRGLSFFYKNLYEIL